MGKKKKVLSVHTYSRVSVWRGWDLARGAARGSARMFTRKDRGRTRTGKAHLTSAPQGVAASQERARRCHVSPLLTPPSPPRRTRGSYGTLFNQLLHHNQLRSHRRGFFRPELMLIAAAQMPAHHPNLTRFVR